MTKKILLASASPRRRSLLGLLGVSYDVTKANIDETPLSGEAAADYTLRLSREKAQAVLKNVDSDCLILAADTTVADGTAILGKPADPVEARAMLLQLRGRVHQVYTAITLLDATSGRIHSEVALTDVCMRSYTDAEMEAYIASGDPFDKAGGYAIQNPEFHPVEELRGCYSNVVGLPLCYLAQALRDFGITLNLKIEFECQLHPGSDCVLNAAMI